MVIPARKISSPPRPVWDFGEPKCLVIPKEAHTYQGFLRWIMADDFPEKLHVTYISGEVSMDLSEECISTHAAVKSGVYLTMLPLVEDEDFGELYTDGVLLGNPEAEVSTNPDGIAARWETFESGRLRFIERKGEPRALEGSPDWVLEIVSDSSVGKDTKRLRDAYHRARIPEYWLIDARREEILFQILVWRPTAYVAAGSRDGWLHSKVFERDFRLTRKRNRLNRWTYTLAVRRAIPKSKPRN
jgi:Uma2 family endonuclease